MNRNDWEKQVKDSDLNLNPNARLIGLVLGAFGNWKESKTVEPGESRLADETGLSADTIATYMDAFVEQGWIKPMGKGKYNTTIYELCPVTHEATGVLAKKKRKMNNTSLLNLRKGQPVPEPTGNLVNMKVVGSSRTVPDLVPESTEASSRTVRGVVPGTTETNQVNNQEELERQPKTPAAPVVPIRTDEEVSPPSPNVDTDDPALTLTDTDTSSNSTRRSAIVRVVNPVEKKEFDSQVRIHRATPEQAAQALSFIEAGNGSKNFSEAVHEALEAAGVHVEVVW